MAFEVDFYKFNKKTNSTKRPYGSGVKIMCDYKGGSSILTPRLVLNLSGAWPGFNYAYISDTGRYYKINDISWDLGFWVVDMSVDVLSSFRRDIGSEYFYILRAAADYDGDIVDNLYPTDRVVETYSEGNKDPFPITSMNFDGFYVIGLLSQPSGYETFNGSGSVNYYIFSDSEMNTFRGQILDQSGDFWTWDGITTALAKSFFNPVDYIVSIKWFPMEWVFIPGSGWTEGSDYVKNVNIKFGWWDLPNVVKGTILKNSIYDLSLSIPVTKHPQATERGAYTNLAPYSRYILDVQPFGRLEIDSTLIKNHSSLTCNISVDMVSGIATMEVRAGSTIVTTTTQVVGINVQLSNNQSDFLGAISGTVSTVASVATGNLAAAGNAGNIVDSILPQIQGKGTDGGRNSYYPHHKPRLTSIFYTLVDDDKENEGRPLYKVRKPEDIPGYIQVYNADIATYGTYAENAEIKALLEGGFYYE